MKERFFSVALIVFFAVGVNSAQGPASNVTSADPVQNMSNKLTEISKSVQTLSDRLKAFVDKFEKVGGLTFTEKQQELVFGMEILVRSEQLVAVLQKSQTELTEKMNDTRGKLSQVDIDLRPRSIDRSVSLVGTTETDELRESKRQKLLADRLSLSQLLTQLQSALAENGDKLREAQLLANNLRRQYLPQIDREMYKQ